MASVGVLGNAVVVIVSGHVQVNAPVFCELVPFVGSFTSVVTVACVVVGFLLVLVPKVLFRLAGSVLTVDELKGVVLGPDPDPSVTFCEVLASFVVGALVLGQRVVLGELSSALSKKKITFCNFLVSFLVNESAPFFVATK